MENLDINFFSFLFDFLISILVYMLIPVTLYICKKDIKEDEPKKIAIINSIVGFIIFVILFILIKKDISLMTGTPAFFYGYINYRLLKSRVKKEEYKYPNEEQENEELEKLINKLEKEKSNK